MARHKRVLSRQSGHSALPSTNVNVNDIFREQSRYVPLVGVVQHFWHEVKEMQGWWPVLLPFLAWVGWRTYHQERQQVLHERRARQISQQQAAPPQLAQTDESP
jgi:hypothetical protein